MGGPCSNFSWEIPRDMMMPELVRHSQEAMESGQLLEARALLVTYLEQHAEGVFAEGARWAVAALPDPSDEPGKEWIRRIDRLQAMKTETPESIYAPWALCAMGDLYLEAGWGAEASGMFEAFLRSYPEHPLAGGVMVEAGLGYLKNGQYLEAALVLRRVVEEPKWKDFRLQGALGLADATALAKAWKQAYYWFRVVEAERPELIRESGDSAYHYGLVELAMEHPLNALSWFLMVINLHPESEASGLAFVQISEFLFQQHDVYPALWFADQARLRFPDSEAGRRGLASLIRWVVGFLSEAHDNQEWRKVYHRFNELDIYLSLSWDHVLEHAAALRFAPEVELAEESVLWMGQAYHALQDEPAAIQSFAHLVVVASTDGRRQEARTRLRQLLHQQVQSLYDRQAWVKLLKFHNEHQKAFQLLPLERTWVLMVAKAYQQINLPAEAWHWYDRLLQEHPDSPVREDILFQMVLLAEEQGKLDLVRETGMRYLQEYPHGQHRERIHAALGKESLAHTQYAQAITHFSEALQDAKESTAPRHILRDRALAYQMSGQTERAIEDLRRMMTLEPAHIPDVLRLGDLLFDHGEYVEAVGIYDHILNSESPAALLTWARYRKAMSLEHMGQNREAEKLLSDLRQLDTQSPDMENTIRLAANAVLQEMTVKDAP